MDLTPAQLRTKEQLVCAGSLPPFDPELAERLRSDLDARLELGGITGPGEAIWLGKHRLNDHQRCDGLFESGMLREGDGFEHSPRTAAGALFHMAIELDVATERGLDPHSICERAAGNLESGDGSFGRYWTGPSAATGRGWISRFADSWSTCPGTSPASGTVGASRSGRPQTTH